MEATSNKFAVVELKYDEGKTVIVRRDWFLKFRQKYNKTVDEFCYWSHNLGDSPEELTCEYSKKFTGEPALFKVFVMKLTDTLEEAEEYLKGRMKSVSNKFRYSALTDEELKKINLKRKRSEKKELKTLQAQAYTQNMEYLMSEVKVQIPAPSTSSLTSHVQVDDDESGISGKKKPKKKKKDKSSDRLNNGNRFELETHTVNEDEKNNDQSNLLQQLNFSKENEDVEMEKYEKTYDKLKRKKKKKIKQLDENEGLNSMTDTRSASRRNREKDADETNSNTTEDERCTDNMLTNQSDLPSLSDEFSPHYELPLGYEFSYDDLIDSIVSSETNVNFEVSGEDVETSTHKSQSIKKVASTSEISEVTLQQSEAVINHVSSISSINVTPTIQVNPHNISPDDIIVLNFDELTSKYNDAISEVSKLKSENENLKVELGKSDRRNKLLQDYLVAVDERVPEALFVEKDGGRLYRGDVFITKKQCTVLDKAKTDNEYLNNLLLCIFGRDVLSTHTLSGKSSNKTKDAAGSVPSTEKLDKNRVDLIYDIMEARAVGNKTKKLSKTEINTVISKKISNIKSYTGKKL